MNKISKLFLTCNRCKNNKSNPNKFSFIVEVELSEHSPGMALPDFRFAVKSSPK